MQENQKIFIVDIDGTLAEHRSHRGPFEEHLVINDKPLPTCKVIKSLIRDGQSIIFISGRTDKCNEDTIKWLQIHVMGDTPFKLYMRKFGDYRSDDIIKEEIYNTYIKDKYEVIGVFDDRLKVVKMWEKNGLFVFNCNQGLVEF